MKKTLALLAIIVLSAIYLYSFRFVYRQPYDVSYSRDLFDFSQWRIPNSVRSLGDDLLYQVAGYDLVNGGQYFDINPEVPPLGKYFLGWSINTFGNAYWANIPLYLLALIGFYYLAKFLTKSTKQALLATIFLTLQSIFFNQLSTTLLDLPLLVSFLCHLYFLIRISDSSHPYPKKWLVLAGLSLGAFISIKIGLLAMALVLADSWLLYKRGRLWQLAIILALAGAVYPLTYLPYFLQGHTLVEFARSQLWMIQFYAKSQASAPVYLAITNLLTGWYKGWSQGAVWGRSFDWNLTWPVFTGFAIVTIGQHLRRLCQLDTNAKYLLLIATLLLVFYSFIPFFTRYLLLVIPLLILVFVSQSFSYKPFLVSICMIVLLLTLPQQLMPNPQSAAEHIGQLWSQGAYQDLYSYLQFTPEYHPQRAEFWRQNQQRERQLTVSDRQVKIQLANYHWWNQKIPLTIRVSYFTQMGEVQDLIQAQLVKQHNRWLLQWQPPMGLGSYDPQTHLLTKIRYGRYGSLLTDQQTILIKPQKVPYFSVTRSQIANEPLLLKQLYQSTLIDRLLIERQYRANWQPDWPSPIGPMRPDRDINTITKAPLDPGISWQYRPGRLYSYIHRRNLVKLIKNLEDRYLSKLLPQNGGVVYQVDKSGHQQLIINRPPRHGQTVILNRQDSNLFAGYN